MAGHNKWSQIKHKKAKTDAQKGKAFSKVVREIMMAVKENGPDPSMNSRLRLALQKAKEVNMPNDNVKRAIQKGEKSEDQLEELLFEGYGPDGVAILINTVTDNRNRTVPRIREILGKHGGSMASQGAVSYLFKQKGLLVFAPGTSEEQIIELALENNADDVLTKDDGSIEVTSTPADFDILLNSFINNDIHPVFSDISQIPSTMVELSDEKSNAILRLIDALEDDDDIQAVHTNLK